MRAKVRQTSILIELCAPRDAYEKTKWGTTKLPEDKNLYEIWLNSRQPTDELVDSFFHEITHAFLSMYLYRNVPNKVEHRLCNLIGYFAKSVICSYLKFKKGF